MKPIIEHLQALPEPYRTQALQNLPDSARSQIPKENQVEALYGAFVWAETPQGHEYWSDFRKQLEAPPPPVSNTNLLIGCLYEIQKTAAEAREEGPYDCTDIMDSIMLNIDSCLSSLSPPCNLSKWNNDYPS